jgi:predicted DNA-binding transcriptional regulator AlpA
MTPIHQKLIDQLLRIADRRAHDLLTGLGYQVERDSRIEDLRASPLGQHLATLANYSEGYPAAGNIRTSAQEVALHFHANPLQRKVFKFPEGFHKTDLGELINAALLRFYNEERPGQLLTIKDMQQLFGVSRQAVHQWIKKGDIFPVWVKNTTRFYRKDVDRLIEKKAE